MLSINAWVSNIIGEIGNLWRIYGKYTVVHENIRTLHLILCMSIAIVGRNKSQMRETHAQCVRVGRSGYTSMGRHLGGGGHRCRRTCTYCYSGKYLWQLWHHSNICFHTDGGHFAHQIRSWYSSAAPSLMLFISILHSINLNTQLNMYQEP